MTAGPGRSARPPHWRKTTGIAAALAAAIAAVVLVTGHSHARPRDAAARAPGAAGVAAAYGYPLRCLSVSIALHDPRFARADFDHILPCGSYTGYETAIFRRVNGAWAPVLEAMSYPCPVRSLPRPVQVELGVCLPPSIGAAPARRSSRQWARSLTQ